jgi:signal transduction histidine kinase
MIKKSPVILYGLLLLIPACIIAGIAARLLTHEKERLGRLTESTELARLQSVAQQVEGAVKTAQSDLLQSLQNMPDEQLEAGLTTWEQSNPLIRNVFIWRGANQLQLPDNRLPLTREQQGFLQRYTTLFNGIRAWEQPNGKQETDASYSFKKISFSRQQARPAQHGGWIPWYWENQFGLLGWTQKSADGPRYGMELEMIALLADMHTLLPRDLPENRLMALVDGNGHIIHQSGGLEPGETLQPALRVSVGATLPHWEVVIYTPSGNFNRASTGYALLGGLLIAVLFISLFAAGGLLLRETHRSRTDAQQKTTFVSNVSHELKTPLTTIRMYAELLGEGRVKDPEKATRYLQTISGESRRLTRLVNNVLDFNRLEQNRKKYQLAPLDLGEIVDETVQAQRIRLAEADMELTLNLPSKPTPIETDRDAIQQVLLNLIDNAIKYGASGRQLTIELTEQNAIYSIAVTDAGPGIPRKHRARIFERFYRIDDSITANTQGCGLGLGIARRLLADLNGTLDYQPAKNGGACFIITLPAGENLA